MGGTVKERGEEDEVNLSNTMQHASCRVMQLSVLAMLGMLLAFLSVCIWYFAYSSPRLAILRVTEALHKDILNKTVEFFDELFRLNMYGAKSLGGMLEKDLLGNCVSLESFNKIRAASWSLFKAIPLITSIGVTTLNGFTGFYTRGGVFPGATEASIFSGTGPFFVYTNSAKENVPSYIESVNASTGEGLEEAKEHYFKENLKSRTWIQSALSIPLKETAWNVDISPINGKPYIQFGIPVSCFGSKEMTVVHCAQSCISVTDFLSTSLDRKGANVFVMNDVGEVLFTSEQHCSSRNSTEACDQGHSEVREAVKFIETQTRLTQLVNEKTHYTDVRVGRRSYFIDSSYHSFQGLKLAVVIMIPRQSVWRAMDSQTRFALVAIPTLAVGLSAVGCGLIYLLLERVATEVKLRADLLRQFDAKRRAEANRDAKSAFLSHMSHELRTPMACIIGLLEILMGDLKLSEHESSVKQVHRCATSLVTLLNSVLDIAKVEAGKLELESAEFELESELSSLIDVFSVQCDAKGLDLSLQLSDDIPKLVRGDAGRVMQIFTNLLGNGIKFTLAGRIVVRGWVEKPESGTGVIVDDDDDDAAAAASTLDSSQSKKDKVVMMFEVDDTGPGIDKALREKVFENFVQGDVSTRRTHGGTGLGLGIARSLVQLMGGAITIEDKTGNGTLFQFSLCFDLPPEQSVREPDVVKFRQIVLTMPEKDCRDGVALWMEERGLSVHQASSWEDVLVHLKVLPLSHFGGRKIEENSDEITQDDDSKTCGRSKHCGAGIGRSPNGCGTIIRRSKSDGTSDSKVEKLVLIVDVNLLPPFSNEIDYLQAFEKLRFPIKTRTTSTITTPTTTPTNTQTPYRTPLNYEAVVFVTASNTPAAFKRALKLLNRSILVRRPLHATRLRDLFHQLEAREQFVPQLDGKTVNNVTKPPLSIQIAKQVVGEMNYSSDEYPEGPVSSSSVSPRNPNYLSTENETTDEKQGSILKGPTRSSDSLAGSRQVSEGSSSLARSKSDNVAKLMKLSWAKPPSVKALQQLDILVAEDHPLLRRLATTMLRKLGASSYEAANGEEALTSVVTRFETGMLPFHCILMDCQMPTMDGYDACKAIREFEKERGQHTCIIALTANAMATDMQKCFQVGMDAFLSKPIQQDHLIRVILSTMAPRSEEADLPNQNSGET